MTPSWIAIHHIVFNKLWPLIGTTYPHCDHYLPYLEAFNKGSYFAVIVGTTQVSNLLENFVFRKILALCCPLEGHGIKIMETLYRKSIRHSRDTIDGRNTKMNKMNGGQEAHLEGFNARYEMNWADMILGFQVSGFYFQQIHRYNIHIWQHQYQTWEANKGNLK